MQAHRYLIYVTHCITAAHADAKQSSDAIRLVSVPPSGALDKHGPALVAEVAQVMGLPLAALTVMRRDR